MKTPKNASKTPDFFEKLSLNARKILRAAILITQNDGEKEVRPKHLLTAILLEKGSLGSTLLEKFGITLEDTREEISSENPAEIEILPRTLKEPSLSERTRNIIAEAFLLANKFSYPYVGSEHFVHALIESHDPDIDVLFSSNLKSRSPKAEKETVSNAPIDIPEVPGFSGMTSLPDIGFVSNQSSSQSDTPSLREYGYPLGNAASGQTYRTRAKEIESVLRTLGRKTKSNPLLIGEPGVGKTTIVEAVAERLAKGLAGPAFRDTKILFLDLPALVAGTSFRGEFEARLRDVVREAREHPNIILFLDEIHTLVGAGNASGGLDAANILKPALSRGDIRCIGATTFAEYKRHIEKDAALERRFQPIRIAEPSAEATIEMLEESREDYESHHHLTIGKDAVRAAVDLSIRHIPSRFLPDKAFDLLDEAASLLRRRTMPLDRSEKYAEISLAHEKVSELKNQLVKDRKFEEAKSIRTEEIELENQLRRLSDEENRTEKVRIATLSKAVVAETVAIMTETPLEKILNEKSESLATLLPKLSASVIGQESAMLTLSRSIVRSQLDLGSRSNRPSGSFLFLGPSGVGKTLAAKTLAENLFAAKHAFLRFDMSEFRERHAMAQMIGSPAGYVGFGEGGKLTEHLRRHPSSVVLFDEIEKAHPDVLNLLLQILEEGTLTDAEGRKSHFGESVVILTSNIGTESFQKEHPFGFSDRPSPSFEALQEETLQKLKQSIRPELLARLDRIIVFRPLDKSALSAIADRDLRHLAENLKRRNIRLRKSPKLEEFIGEESAKEPGGARAVRKMIGERIEDPIADILLSAKRVPKEIAISVSKGRIAVKTRP